MLSLIHMRPALRNMTPSGGKVSPNLYLSNFNFITILISSNETCQENSTRVIPHTSTLPPNHWY